ncbi:hypothetical protein VIGAN_03177600 [Vigna angularis var. angularis]|uniref:Uncharacterized protein n=1 Tax=Vigna angularis var. angularis TaxID=157739 RepID=A0A0S3RMP9_PHAAN|nr:hypothetical protein VIGAN_03177600 [Vigna angularis var. angularis]
MQSNMCTRIGKNHSINCHGYYKKYTFLLLDSCTNSKHSQLLMTRRFGKTNNISKDYSRPSNCVLMDFPIENYWCNWTEHSCMENIRALF